MSSEGPYLYQEGPEPLHTSPGRRRQGLLLWVFGGTALVAVLMVVFLPLVKGSAEDQSREVVAVFLAALDTGDDETAHQLLCEDERAALATDEVGPRYLGGHGTGRVVASSDGEVDGDPVQRVEVEWSDGTTSEFTVVNADGPHVCGISAGS